MIINSLVMRHGFCYVCAILSGWYALSSRRDSSFPHRAGARRGPLPQINRSTGLSPTTKSIREAPKGTSLIDGARDGTRTHDLLITKAGRIYVLFLVAFSNRLSMRLFCVLLFAVYGRLSQFLAVTNNK